MHCFQNSTSFDWVAFSALVVAVFSLGIGVYFNHRTLLLTERHNKKTIEPLICDLYTANTIVEIGKNSLMKYQIKNCGLGPAIIKSLSFKIDKKNYILIFDIYKQYLGNPKYIHDLSTGFTLEQFHILAPNESLVLFEVYFKGLDDATQFHNLVKKVEFSVDYETIYGDKRTFKKNKLSTI
jgi:hypothetical protein